MQPEGVAKLFGIWTISGSTDHWNEHNYY